MGLLSKLKNNLLLISNIKTKEQLEYQQLRSQNITSLLDKIEKAFVKDIEIVYQN